MKAVIEAERWKKKKERKKEWKFLKGSFNKNIEPNFFKFILIWINNFQNKTFLSEFNCRTLYMYILST